MRLLIDTQIFIWAVIDSDRLGAKARQVMLDAAQIFVSAASIWEIAIKSKLGKLEGDPREFVAAIEQSGFHELAISAQHAAMVHELPLHHRDPFDRLLIAQSLCEPLRLLTADKNLSQYSELVMTV
ncbi:MAG: type II toxin-antitoxin system VapC family toxin [Desulfoferrobacter sp.]